MCLKEEEAKFYEIDDWFETSNQLRCCSLWGLSRVLELSKRKPANPAGFFFVQTCVSSGNVGPNTDKLFGIVVDLTSVVTLIIRETLGSRVYCLPRCALVPLLTAQLPSQVPPPLRDRASMPTNERG